MSDTLQAMTPLGAMVYQVLRLRVPKPNWRKAVIDHSELIAELYRLFPEAPRDLDLRDPRLDAAAVELVAPCQALGLPAISALIIHGDTRLPADSYFAAACPGLTGDARRAAWEKTLAEVIVTLYPPKLSG